MNIRSLGIGVASLSIADHAEYGGAKRWHGEGLKDNYGKPRTKAVVKRRSKNKAARKQRKRQA